ncbi:MAG: glycosyltransferase family 39 protein [Candidatus Omnitrophota bacterium]
MKKTMILLAVFALAFVVRAVFLSGDTAKLECDEAEYERLALNLVSSRGYINSADGSPTALRPPLYPVFLAATYEIFGHDLFIVRMIQVILSALTVCLLCLIAYRIFDGTAALVTAVMTSFYMPFARCSGMIYTETLFTFLLVLIVYMALRIKRPGPAAFCLLGLLCGLLTLVRSTAFLIPFVLVPYLFFRMRDVSFAKKAVVSLALVLSFVAAILPWSVRNYRVFGRPVFVSTNAGLNLYQAVSFTGGKVFDLDTANDPVAAKADAIVDEVERNDFYVRSAFDVYMKRPLFTLKMFAVRVLFFLNVYDWEILGGETLNYHFLFVLPFAVLGSVFSLRRRKDAAILFLSIIYFAAFTLLFPGTPRYRFPIDGFIIVLASYGLVLFMRRYTNKVYPALAVSAYLIITYILYAQSLQVKYAIRELMRRIGLW